MRFSQVVFFAALITAIYLFAFAIMFWLLMPLQSHVASAYVAFAQVTCFVALPHGVRVIATWLLRWRAIFFLIPGTALEAVVLADHFSLGARDALLMQVGFATNSFIAFEISRAAGHDAYASPKTFANWRSVVLVGAVAALINGLFLSHVDFGFSSRGFTVWLWANALVGSTVGLVAWLFLVRIVMRRFVSRLSS